MRRTFGNISYDFSSQPQRALLTLHNFFPKNAYDRFGLILFGPFQRLVVCFYLCTGIKNSICEHTLK